MRYDIRGRQGAVVWAISSDGVVKKAHDLIPWSVGQKVSALIAWAVLKRLKIYVTPEGGSTRKIETEQEDA